MLASPRYSEHIHRPRRRSTLQALAHELAPLGAFKLFLVCVLVARLHLLLLRIGRAGHLALEAGAHELRTLLAPQVCAIVAGRVCAGPAATLRAVGPGREVLIRRFLKYVHAGRRGAPAKQ